MPLTDMVDAHGSPVTSPGRTVFVRIFDRGALTRAPGSHVGNSAFHRFSRYWIGLEIAVPTAPRKVPVGNLAVSVLITKEVVSSRSAINRGRRIFPRPASLRRSKEQSQWATPNRQPGVEITSSLSLRLPNALPFNCKPAAESAPRLYTMSLRRPHLQRLLRQRR